jgi:hypothetical protein
MAQTVPAASRQYTIGFEFDATASGGVLAFINNIVRKILHYLFIIFTRLSVLGPIEWNNNVAPGS